MRSEFIKNKIGFVPPEDWKVYKLGELTEINSNTLGTKTSPDQRINYIDLGSVNTGTIDLPAEEFIFKDAPSRARRVISAGDILMSTVRPNLKGFARADDKTDGFVCSTGFAVLSTKSKVDSKLIYQSLFTESFERQFYQLLVGSSYPAINNSDVEKLFLAMPNGIEERKSIVEILSTWDEAISKTEKLIKTKKQYKKGLMQRLLTGKIRFSEFVRSEEVRRTRFGIYPKDWEYVKIQEVANQVKDKVGDETEGYTVMSCTKHDGLVSSLEYFDRQVFSKDISNYKVVEKGEFAYATNHVEEGSIGYNNWCEKGAISPMYTVFKADQDKIDNDYLYAIIKTENYRRIFEIFTNGTVNRRGSLRWKDFKKIKVPVPAVEEQKAISTVLKKAEQEIQLLEEQLEKYQLQKKGLMQQLLTGKVRVN